MGFLDWLLGRKQKTTVHKNPEHEQLPPVIVVSREAFSTQVTPPAVQEVKPFGTSGILLCYQQGGHQVVMDRDTYEYLYGEHKGPDPCQRDLDALWPGVTRVCVLEGAMFQGRVFSSAILLDVTDRDAIEQLKGCLRIVEDPSTFHHCGCLGGPTIELYAGPRRLATISLQHGEAIRWKRWHHDARLEDGQQLSQWLVEQGLSRPRLESLYERGNTFLFEENQALSAREKQADQAVLQAQACVRQKAYQEAFRLLTEALQLDGTHHGAYALRGELYYHADRFGDALSDFQAAIARGHREAETYLKVGLLLEESGKNEEALGAFCNVIESNSGNVMAYDRCGIIRCKQGNYDEAYADFSEAIRLAPKWGIPYLHRGLVQHLRGQLDASLGDYDQAIELLKETPEDVSSEQAATLRATLCCRRGDVHLDLFREADAEADFARAREHHAATALLFTGEMWLRRSDFRRARETFSEYLAIHAHDPTGLQGRGLAQEALGEYEAAITDYSESLRQQPENTSCYFLRARVRFRLQQRSEALVDLTEHLQRHPDDVMAYVMRAQLYQSSGNHAQALKDKNAAHHAAPENPDISNSLAWFLATCGEAAYRDGPRAVTLARLACELTKWTNSNHLDTLAAALAETGEYDEAARWQSVALNLSPSEQAAGRRARLELYHAGKPYRE